MKDRKLIIKLFLSALVIFYFFFNVFILSHYGTSWDEFVHYQRGQVYLQYFLTGNGNNFDSISSRESIYKTFKAGEDWRDFSFWLKKGGHPPLNGLLATVSNRIFYQNLGIFGDIESYHLFLVLASVFLVAIVFYWVNREYGLFAGIVSFLSLALYPLFFAESHFNIKDPVEASFYAATLIFFYNGITKNNWKWIIGSSLFAGLALGTKFNILFTIFTILPWLVIFKWKEIRSFKFQLTKKIIFACVVSPFIAFGILYATWPFLWQSPINNMLKIFSYYKEIGATITYQPAEYLIFGKINTFALQWIFYTTPLVILIFSLIGIFYSLTRGFKEKNKTSLFILFWFFVPIVRVSLPNAGIYGGVRQIMEYIPAMAILAGIGAKYIVEIVRSQNLNSNLKSFLNKKFLQLLIILSFLPITFKIISIHPNENVYFNLLIGGLKGAKEKNIIYWGNTFGNVYRQGVTWINKNAEKDSKVALGASYEDGIPRIWFREDINYSNTFRSGMQKKGEYIFELTHDMPTWSHFYYYNYARNMLKPVYEIKVDDIPILTVWKNDWEHTKDEFRKEEETIDIKNIKKDKNSLLIDLEQELLLTELNIVFSNPSCHFTKDGYFVTADSKGNWTNHPGDLGEIAFYEVFNPRKNKDTLSYLFPGGKTQLIKIIYSEDNNCFEDIKKINIKRIP